MKMAYAVWVNSDSVEGRGVDRLQCLCVTEALAKEVAKGQGPMGASDGRIERVYILQCAKDRDLAIRNKKLDLILGRLSDEEVSLLKDYLTGCDT